MDKSAHKQGTGKRVIWILVIGVIAAAVVSMATTRTERYVAPPATSESLARLSARKLQSVAADQAIVSVALAGRNELAEQFGKESPQYVSTSAPNAEAMSQRAKGGLRFSKIRSDAPHTEQSLAEADAIMVAQQKIGEQLRALHPPIETLPSAEMIRKDYLRNGAFQVVHPTEEDRRLWQSKNLEPNRVWVELESLEITAEQLRQLRSTERLQLGSWWAGIGLVVLAALWGFFKFDAWTRGYLTMILGLGFAATAGGIVALLFWIR